MSQSSRYKAQAPWRHREQVARAIAELELTASIFCGLCQGAGIDFDCDCPRDHRTGHNLAGYLIEYELP